MPDTPRIPDLERDLVAAARRLTPVRARRAPRIATLSTAAAVAIAAAIAFAAGAGSDPQAAAEGVRSGGVLLGDYFAVFRSPAQAADPSNPFEGPMKSLLRVDPATARRLDVPGQDLWVAASDTQVCIAHVLINQGRSVAGACARPAQLVDDGLFGTGQPAPADILANHLPKGATELAGLVPDGVSSVTITLADGSRQTIAANDNGVAATFPSTPTMVAFRDRDNVLHTTRYFVRSAIGDRSPREDPARARFR
jgi:hypothetical protein